MNEKCLVLGREEQHYNLVTLKEVSQPINFHFNQSIVKLFPLSDVTWYKKLCHAELGSDALQRNRITTVIDNFPINNRNLLVIFNLCVSKV